MLLQVCVLLAGCFCHGSADVPRVTVLQDKMAELPCPHKTGDISWSRYQNDGMKHILVSVKNGRETRPDRRFGLLADNSMIILRVKPSDSAMYFCNLSQIYLDVTTDPSMVTPRPGGRGLDFGSGQEADPADTENQQPSDLWKVLVGVVVGVSLALLSIFVWRTCSRRTRATDSTSRTKEEVVYEEIDDGKEQPRGSDVEPHYQTSETPSSFPTGDDNLYSTLNELENNCVYYFTQNPPQAGNTRE